MSNVRSTGRLAHLRLMLSFQVTIILVCKVYHFVQADCLCLYITSNNDYKKVGQKKLSLKHEDMHIQVHVHVSFQRCTLYDYEKAINSNLKSENDSES